MNIKLITAIKLSGLKQWQVARKANLSEVRLSKIVNESSRLITASEKKQIAIALGLPIEELFSIEETEYNTSKD